MFKDHSDSIWGTRCQCGSHVYILQNKFHPWDAVDFVARVSCPACGEMVSIDSAKAAAYYNEKILAYFSNVHGTVLDLGCGGGFLTQHLLTQPGVTQVLALDNDPGCQESIAELADSRAEFILADAGSLGSLLASGSIDFAVSRDVFMFIEDTDRFFADLSRIVRRGIRQMGWYRPSIQRIKNDLAPEAIKTNLSALGWNVSLEYLDWYKSGYFIKADK